MVFEKNRQNVKNVCVDIGNNNDLGKTANHFWKSIVIVFFLCWFSVESPIFFFGQRENFYDIYGRTYELNGMF